MFNNWVLDVTFVPDMPPVFVPYEDDGTLVLGMNVMSEFCPGELVGVIHEDGQEAVEKWCAENPNWHKQYSRPIPLALDGAIVPDSQQVLPADVLVGGGTLPEPPRQ